MENEAEKAFEEYKKLFPDAVERDFGAGYYAALEHLSSIVKDANTNSITPWNLPQSILDYLYKLKNQIIIDNHKKQI